jgi:exopolysaccharide biosynthesis protein
MVKIIWPILILICFISLEGAASPEVFINNRKIELSLKINPLHPYPLFPLRETAKYMGGGVSYLEATKEVIIRSRWGKHSYPLKKLFVYNNKAYIPIKELAQILGARILHLEDVYIYTSQSELLSLSRGEDGITLKLSHFAPLEVTREGDILVLKFYNTVLRIAPGRFSGGGIINSIKLSPKNPHITVVEVALRFPYGYEIRQSESEKGFLVRLEFSNRWSSEQAALKKQAKKTSQINYYTLQRWGARVNYLKIKDYRLYYNLTVALPSRGIGTLETLKEMAKINIAVAGINASFFDPQTKMPIGLLIKNGKVLSEVHGQRAVLAIDIFGRVHFLSSLKDYPIQDAISAGPMLLEDGRIIPPHEYEREGFNPNFINSKANRSAIALTKDGDLILLNVTGRGMSLGELALLLKQLGSWDAMALDGGSSSSLVFRDGITLRNLGGRRKIATALVLIPKLN